MPIRQASQVMCSAEARESNGFCAITPPAYNPAATTHSTLPHPAPTPRSDVASPTTIAPVKAIAQPITSVRGKPSPRSRPARSAINNGPTFTSMAAVPASTRCSASFSTGL